MCANEHYHGWSAMGVFRPRRKRFGAGELKGEKVPAGRWPSAKGLAERANAERRTLNAERSTPNVEMRSGPEGMNLRSAFARCACCTGAPDTAKAGGKIRKW